MTARGRGSRTPGARDLRGEAARLRRAIRRARAELAGEEVEEARVAAEGHEVVVDRSVFDQLVEHALRETLAEVADGPERPRDLVVHVLGDRATPLARRLVELTAGGERAESALVTPAGPRDGVIGLAALLLPARSRPTRAATGAQAIRTARAVGSPSAPVGVPAGVGGPGLGVRSGGSGPDDSRGSEGWGGDGRGGDGPGPDEASMPTPATGWSLPDDDAEDADAAIPAARMPSTPVQAHRDGVVDRRRRARTRRDRDGRHRTGDAARSRPRRRPGHGARRRRRGHDPGGRRPGPAGRRPGLGGRRRGLGTRPAGPPGTLP